MAGYQIFSLFLGFAGLFSWIAKSKKINMLSLLVDTDKRERKKLLDNYYIYYMVSILILCSVLWNSHYIGYFIYLNFGVRFSPNAVAVTLCLFFWVLPFIVRYVIKKSEKKNNNNKIIRAIVNSSYNLKPKKLNIGVIKGSFLNSKLQTFLSFIVRIDDFTIQKINFDKEGILLKKEYLKNIFKYNLFNEEDFEIIEKIEKEINSINEFEFEKYENMKHRIIQLIKAIQSQKKYTFAFGQIKQYSNSKILDEVLIFLQEIQENRYSDDSLPYLVYFQKHIN